MSLIKSVIKKQTNIFYSILKKKDKNVVKYVYNYNLWRILSILKSEWNKFVKTRNQGY